MSDMPEIRSFDDLGLSKAILQAVKDSGYEEPSPIQSASIPPLLQGKDVLGQAQTGTGKTAAFALPILSKLDMETKGVQVLVLTPTRELAIQVSEAFQSYAKHLKGFHVMPIYGGQSYTIQLRQLKRGVQVVVGAPGRVMDHIRRKTLVLDQLKTLVLDEADEMLRMGFIDDVDWILSHTPKTRQIALYSATMPNAVKKVAVNHLNKPVDIKIKSKTTTAKNINQRYWLVSGLHKLDALTRVLETEEFDAVLIFVRTKIATEELAEKLQARGFAAEALNGDIIQKQSERLVAKLKNGAIDILIGTDVVARGLDVERISHVVNYDIPYDPESYVHRIGRTGRAGRSGEAILFVARREQRMLRMIEKTTNQVIQPMKMPSVADINVFRMQKFKDQINQTLASADLGIFEQLVREFQHENDVDPKQIAAALASMVKGDTGLLLSEGKGDKQQRSFKTAEITNKTAEPLRNHPEVPMLRYCMDVGRNHGVQPANIVGMIANEAEMDREYIGVIEIYDDVTTVDLPADMPNEIKQILKKARVCGRRTEIDEIDKFKSSGSAGFDSGSKSDSDNYKPKRKRKPRTSKGKDRAHGKKRRMRKPPRKKP
ncbi:MAG: DEAD/DEAH box helicase [Proteobacteria bacterium]|nr:DEAD/DEAH box helicase [Pseudomonadota bacterium]